MPKQVEVNGRMIDEDILKEALELLKEDAPIPESQFKDRLDEAIDICIEHEEKMIFKGKAVVTQALAIAAGFVLALLLMR